MPEYLPSVVWSLEQNSFAFQLKILLLVVSHGASVHPQQGPKCAAGPWASLLSQTGSCSTSFYECLSLCFLVLKSDYLKKQMPYIFVMIWVRCALVVFPFSFFVGIFCYWNTGLYDATFFWLLTVHWPLGGVASFFISKPNAVLFRSGKWNWLKQRWTSRIGVYNGVSAAPHVGFWDAVRYISLVCTDPESEMKVKFKSGFHCPKANPPFLWRVRCLGEMFLNKVIVLYLINLWAFCHASGATWLLEKL